ncbi:MAG: DNA-3-methyladenine glycosylase I [Candidatus Limnocylindrales bacterium]
MTDPTAARPLPRCWWSDGAEPTDPMMVEYHDTEWGVPAHGDSTLFERLALESFQAGLSWSTILHKRPAFRDAFAEFEPTKIAAFGAEDVRRLVEDVGIVRNLGKIEATIGNARVVVEIAREAGSLDAWLWGQLDGPPRRLPPDATREDVPSADPLAHRLSRDLRDRGLRFVGPTIVYAFMQSVGMVDDHVPGCWRYGG